MFSPFCDTSLNGGQGGFAVSLSCDNHVVLFQQLVSFVRKRDRRIQAHKVRVECVSLPTRWLICVCCVYVCAVCVCCVVCGVQRLMEEKEKQRQRRVAENREKHRKKRLE